MADVRELEFGTDFIVCDTAAKQQNHEVSKSDML